ncbi:MAG: 2-oxoglutarate dehydrogenase complex dihydrolipoyllysine-residue succinyltransferase [Calditrichaeota bacterium]|nr:MAG: 2-oxoglutarate dehydrogenase complex dihydrolipoyllysine-residue succinyltransferase [Calditrichota bacterium]MBL1204319.1 2-oxoglutarate dehydrogenase complex dihydrolipoyllysine-residue succinyltransferase [Calditrichota bacterium]NOG44149.1 2-oxoglutarate dehydrogenase complex dihydrolipoyllysine-residue succinyltransferase [Calditrichota bacterium]
MKIDVVVPVIGESITEAVMGVWMKEEGAFVEEDEIICEVESEKATVEIVAEKAGALHQKAAEGDTILIGGVIAEIDTSANGADTDDTPEKKQEAPKKAEVKSEPKKESVEPEKQAKVSPVAANILGKAGIESAKVEGSGAGGRVTKADALKALDGGVKQPVKSEPAKTEAPSGERNERRVRMTTLRKTIARRLLDAKHGTAMLTTFNEVDLQKVKELRAQYKDSFKEKYGIGLGFMSLFTKASSIALTEVPAANAMIDGNEIVYHDYADIGIAVSTEKGLVVPIIRNAEKMALHEIELEIAGLAGKARDGKLSIDEMSGGTFTITNGGVFGSMMSTPIINAPQSAILGMHNIIDRPVAINGQVVIRPMMYIALSYDHRIIDGKESVTFLKRVKELLEDPIRMVLEV